MDNNKKEEITGTETKDILTTIFSALAYLVYSLAKGLYGLAKGLFSFFKKLGRNNILAIIGIFVMIVFWPLTIAILAYSSGFLIAIGLLIWVTYKSM